MSLKSQRSASFIRLLRVALIASPWSFSGVSPALAQTADLFLTGDIVESYSQSVNVGSGSGALVGLWLGAASGPLDLKSVRVGIPAGAAATSLCFSAITRDGEYTARGPAALPRKKGEIRGRVGVAALEKSQYTELLKRYRTLDLAVTARWDSNCKLAPKAAYLPAIGTGNVTELVAAVNSGHAVNVGALLRSTSQGVVQGTCEALQQTRTTAFDTLCHFQLPAAGTSGEWNLELRRVPRAGPPRIDDFAVLLPAI